MHAACRGQTLENSITGEPFSVLIQIIGSHKPFVWLGEYALTRSSHCLWVYVPNGSELMAWRVMLTVVPSCLTSWHFVVKLRFK